MTERCRYAGPEQPRVVGPEDDPQPCPERHCVMPWCPGRHVSDERIFVCPTCTRHVREDLEEVARLAARPEPKVLSVVEVEALKAGVTSDAAVLAGPAADPTTIGIRHRRVINDLLAEQRQTEAPGSAQRAYAAWMEDNQDEPHPLWVLGTWDQLVREHLDQPTTLRATIRRCADYLDRSLPDLVRDPEFPIEELGRDIRDCRSQLERVLREGEQVDRGAPCPMCGQAALVMTYGSTIEADRWVCPKCHARYEDADYRNKVEAVYVLNAQALPASQIRATYRVPEGTVRRWASGDRPTVRTRGKDDAGRQLYDVADVLAMRDTQAQRVVAGEAHGA